MSEHTVHASIVLGKEDGFHLQDDDTGIARILGDDFTLLLRDWETCMELIDILTVAGVKMRKAQAEKEDG